ncbi:MAG TPA: folylpolyglutamate synthase/dihydrofolate synthase family protein [Nocardioidaceae bacterium]|nr:folylpolyglutamate synthase/dihydrofolate synthase family protein [Nocardioidaceae bacterium]
MSSPLLPDSAPTYAEAERALLARWPETRLEPSLDRIAAFTELLGEPQRTYPVLHLTGTNGKTSTSRMIDTLLRATDLRTGRFTSPHVESMTERISLDGEPVSEERFLQAYNEVAAIARLVDEDSPHPLSFFEMVVGMAFATFADAPVDAAVVEVGMGGSWDATNVADAAVSVLLPIALDHSAYLGSRPVDIAREKAGIIKPGSRVVCAQQADDVAGVIAERAAEVGAAVLTEGRDFGVDRRVPAVGGQMLRLQGLHAAYDDVFLPLYGAHQAQNAAVALAAVEAFFGEDALDADLVRTAFEEATSPGRLEVIRRSPAILLDVAHNPHGAAAVVDALGDSFALDPLVGVVGVMADKDYEGVLAAFEPAMAAIVCTQNTTPRALRAEDLAEVARGIFGFDRVYVEPRLDDAIERAATLAEQGGVFGEAIGSGGVLVTGSVVTVGEARGMLKRRERL